jgi:hypothetical protein
MNEQIKEVMRNSLLNFSKKMNIPLKQFRIKMILNSDGEPICIAMNGAEELEELAWGKILGLLLSAVKGVVLSHINKKFETLSIEKEIEINDIVIKFYAIDTKGEPNAFLYNKNVAIEKINIDKFI